MTLQQWLAKYKRRLTATKDGSIHVFVDNAVAGSGELWDLHHLDDYAVSAHVSGPAVYLWSREVSTARPIENPG